MFEFSSGTPFLVFVGLLIAQLFLYGRKIKDRVKIAVTDVISDIMQFGVMFVTCMGFLAAAKSITGWDLDDPWQLVTVVIIFNMSFDAWFMRIRDTFNTRVGAAWDALMGKSIPQEEPKPLSRRLKTVYTPVKKPNPELDGLIEQLDNVDNNSDNGGK